MENNENQKVNNPTPPPYQGPMKSCKHCNANIPQSAKKCQYCGHGQGGIIKWVIIAVIAIIVIGAVAGGSDSDSKKDIENNKTEEKQIEYTPVTATQLSEALSNNAMKAENDYKEKYVEITGKLGNIDSSGKYIGIESDLEFDLTSILCYIKSDEQKKKIMEMSKGDPIIVKGYCKDVGEVLGYSIDIDSIEKQ